MGLRWVKTGPAEVLPADEHLVFIDDHMFVIGTPRPLCNARISERCRRGVSSAPVDYTCVSGPDHWTPALLAKVTAAI